MTTFNSKNNLFFILGIILVFVFFNHFIIFLINDFFWDDNLWIISRIISKDLSSFIDNGFDEMQRHGLGIFYYYFYGLITNFNFGFLWLNSLSIFIYSLTIYLILKISLILSNQNWNYSVLTIIFFVINPIDHTLPYLSSINYRLGFLFELISILFFISGVLGNKHIKLKFSLSFLISVISFYFLSESVIAMEVTKFIIGYYLITEYKKKITLCNYFFQIFLYFFTYFSFIAYKFFHQPYGIYISVYKFDILNGFNLTYYYDLLDKILFGLWGHLLSSSFPNKLLLTIVPTALFFISLIFLNKYLVIERIDSFSNKKYLKITLIGISSIFLQNFLFLTAGRNFQWGLDSTHGNFMQFGCSILISSIIFILYKYLYNKFQEKFNFKAFILIILSLIISIGCFINNLNLAQFNYGSELRSNFWYKFSEKFQNLPSNSSFFIDIDVTDEYRSFHETANLDTKWDLEFPLNVLYFSPDQNSSFYQHFVISPEEVRLNRFDFESPRIIERNFQLGKQYLDTKKLIYLKYTNNKIFVDFEILENYPNIKYRNWILTKEPVPFVIKDGKFNLRDKYGFP